MIKDSNILLEELHALHEQGLPVGVGVGFDLFDEHLRLIPGTTTDIMGYPFNGKSLLFRDLVMRYAFYLDWKCLIHSADDGIDAQVAAEMIQTMTGRTFDKTYDNYITSKEVTKYHAQLTQRIHFVSDQVGVEPVEFWTYAGKNGYNMAGLDSWNILSHKGSIKDPDYVGKVLIDRNRLSREHKMHCLTVHHPKNPAKVVDGTVARPTVFDFYGGSEVNNKGNNLVIIHKYEKDNYKEPYEIYVSKLKPKTGGQIGVFHLEYDYPNRVFYFRNEAGGRTYGSGIDQRMKQYNDLF